jgi:endonuclease/exonuclease/phosphatase family metal-dependent hydrolase
MIKLISVNLERDNHYNTVLPFLDKEKADVICLQEAPESFSEHLKQRGYFTFFAPMAVFPLVDSLGAVGILVATKLPQFSHSQYFHRSDELITEYDYDNVEQTLSLAYIMTSLKTPSGNFAIATTHMIDTRDGKENPLQTKAVKSMLEKLRSEPEHLICGDFNMPRGFNNLYKVVTEEYRDEIPEEYQSSLDKNLHRLGNTGVADHIFKDYMVDYIFTKPPYLVKDIHLEFGVSDHAAIVANIYLENR